MLVFREPQYIADWVASKLSASAPTVDAAIGIERFGMLVAGVYFDGFTGGNIYAHIASSAEMLPKDLMVATAKYVYGQLRLQRMTFQVPADNFKTILLVEGLGALPEGRLEKAAGNGQDMLLYVLWKHSDIPQRMLARGASNE